MSTPSIEAETRRRLDRITAEDGPLRAFIRVDADEAMAAAIEQVCSTMQ